MNEIVNAMYEVNAELNVNEEMNDHEYLLTDHNNVNGGPFVQGVDEKLLARAK